jgi:hypothetical protein
MAKTNRELTLNAWNTQIDLPAGTLVRLIKGADGILGDLYAVESQKLLIELTGNSHDPKYRYLFVPSDAVTQD